MSRVAIQTVVPEMFDSVYSLLRLVDSSLTSEAWRRVFDYQWRRPEKHCGYMLAAGDVPVGFLGLIFSERVVEDRTTFFCNITTVIVKPEYRDHTLFLFRPLLQLKHHTLTDLTPNTAVSRVLRRLGFRELDESMALLLPFRLPLFQSGTSFTHDASEMDPELSDVDRRILHDHLPYRHCGFFLLRKGVRHCFVVYTRVSSTRYPYCHIHYVSSPELFASGSWIVRKEIARANRVSFVLLDGRFTHTLPRTARYTLPFRWPKLYKSEALAPECVDNLYSELVLLNIENVPSRRQLWNDLWERNDG